MKFLKTELNLPISKKLLANNSKLIQILLFLMTIMFKPTNYNLDLDKVKNPI